MKNNGVQLVKDKKYEGKFVAIISPSDKHIIASGNTPYQVSKKAEKKGYKEPVIFFVPKSGMNYAY